MYIYIYTYIYICMRVPCRPPTPRRMLCPPAPPVVVGAPNDAFPPRPPCGVGWCRFDFVIVFLFLFI